MKKMLFFSVALFLFFSCAEEKEIVQSVSPPLKNIDIPFTEYAFTASEGKEFNLPNGTTIKIAPDVLEDEKGNAPKGEVTLKYREMHSAAEVFLSGIPMGYDSAGNSHQFGTDGMFEVYAFEGDKPLRIREGKSIAVNMPAYDKENTYNFYQYDKETGNWDYQSTPGVVENTVREPHGLKLAPLPPPPTKPQPLVDGTPLIDINFKVSDFPELKDFTDVMWRYNGPEVGPNVEVPEQVKHAFTAKWKKVVLRQINSENMEYSVTLSNNALTPITLPVTPALKGRMFDQAMEAYDAKFKAYQNSLQENSIASTDTTIGGGIKNILIRSLEIMKFGIFNCDRILNWFSTVNIKMELQIDGAPIDVNRQRFYHLIPGLNTAISINVYKGMPFKFDADMRNFLVAVLPGNDIATFGPEDFRKLNPNSLETQKLVLHKQPAVKNTGDVAALLQ